MWSQNWESLLPLLLNTTFDLDASFKVQGFTILNMMKIAEDFYMSLGLDPLPFRFWRYSQMNKPNGRTGFTCHGTSANMYTGDDYRMMMCAEGTFNDFRVIHHEMGHVQYYMAYKDQPTLFQAGANSAFHEAVGDSVMLGVMSPQHLLRLGILRPVHETPDLDIALLLRMALNKLPQLAFGLIMDKWRWAVMRGTIRPDEYNSAWWQLMEAYLGVVPPTTRTDYDFDPAAKYHILGNTPYIRYYLSGFLEMQFLESMCEAKLHDDNSDVEGPLHRCDIYGSSKAGMRLRRMMELGSSVQWSEALLVMTGGRYNFYSARPLLKYFRPLSKWLDLQISRHQIPVWSPESE